MPDLSEVKSQLEAPNVAAEAVFGRGTVTEGAQRLKDRKAEKGPKEFLDAYNMNKPFQAGLGREAIQKLGIERDTAGAKNRTGDELTRFNKAKSETALIETYLEEGPNSIVPGSAEETRIMEYFERAIVLWPEADAMDPTDRKEYIKKRLKDPRFLGRVKEAYEKELKNPDVFDETVQEKEAAYKKAERDREAKDREIRRIRTEKGEVTADIALYGESAPGAPNSKQRILNDAITEAESAKVQIDNLDTQIASKRNELARKKAELGGLPRNAPNYNTVYGEALVLQTDIDVIEQQKAPEQRKIAIRNQLQQEHEALKARKIKVEDDEFRVKGEQDEAKYNETRARAIYEDAKNSRASQEGKFVDGLERVFYNAALEDMSSNIREMEEFRREELDKLKAQIGDQASKVVLEGIKDRWVNVIKDGTKIKKIELQKGKIEQDYYKLLSEGPKGMLRAMLTEAKDSSGNPIFNTTEIELKLNDPEFTAGAENEFISTLIRKRLQTSKITEGEANLLFDRFGGKIADTAMKKNNDASGMIDRLKEKDGFKGSRKEFLLKMAKNPRTYGGMAGILALLLGTPFLIAGAGIAASAYSAAGSAAGAPFIG